MPNVGRPSRDCHLCRARRVKCDLGRPGCQRCAKYGKDCPGYRDQQELVFRTVDPTGSAATKQKKQQQHRKRKDDVTEAEKHSSSSSSSPSSLSGSNFSDYGELALQPYLTTFEDIVPDSDQDPFAWTIAPSLSQHWTATSVPIVLNIYSSVEFLKDVFQENTTDGPLVWATHLFSRTYVINLQHPTCMSNDSATDSAKELGTYMGKTLSAVATALSTPQGAMRDDIMAAVWMLCNYEIIVGSIGRMETESPWHTHASGLFGMLKSRGKDFLHTQRGRNIFWPTYSLVQLDAILSNHECPPEGEEWLEIIKPYSVGFLGYHTAIFLTKVSKFQCRAGEIVLERDTAAASTECTALFSALTEAENDLGLFTSSLGRNSHDSDDFMMVMHLASIVKAYNILLLLTNLATHDPNTPVPLEILYKRRIYCFKRVRQAAWDILAATPDLIAELVRNRYNVFDALFMGLKLVWPLTAVRLMPTTLPQQKARAAQDLLVIGRQLGVRQATRSYSPVDGIPKEARIPKKPQGFLWEVEVEDDLCIGYMDSELREPLAAELVGHVQPSKSVVPESLDLFMI